MAKQGTAGRRVGSPNHMGTSENRDFRYDRFRKVSEGKRMVVTAQASAGTGSELRCDIAHISPEAGWGGGVGGAFCPGEASPSS